MGQPINQGRNLILHEKNENENTVVQNLWEVVKAVLRGRFIAILVNLKKKQRGQPGWFSGLASPSAQGVILENRDQIPCRAPCMEPASPSACVSASLSLSLSVTIINK